MMPNSHAAYASNSAAENVCVVNGDDRGKTAPPSERQGGTRTAGALTWP